MRLTFIFLLFASLLQAQSNFLNATFKVDSASFVSNYNYILHGKVNGIGYGGDDANIGDRLIFMKDETCGELQIDSVLAASTFYLRVRVFSVDSLFDASPFGVGVLTGKTPNNDFRSSTINASNDLINCIENRFKLEVDQLTSGASLPDSLIYGKGDPDWVAVFSTNDSTIKAGNIRDDGVDITYALPEVAYGIDDTSTPDAGTYGYNGATGRFAYYNAGWRNLISGNVTQNYLMRADANGNAVNAGMTDDGSVLQIDTRTLRLWERTTATLPTPSLGDMVFNTDFNQPFYYGGSSWRPFSEWYRSGSNIYFNTGNVTIGSSSTFTRAFNVFADLGVSGTPFQHYGIVRFARSTGIGTGIELGYGTRGFGTFGTEVFGSIQAVGNASTRMILGVPSHTQSFIINSLGGISIGTGANINVHTAARLYFNLPIEFNGAYSIAASISSPTMYASPDITSGTTGDLILQSRSVTGQNKAIGFVTGATPALRMIINDDRVIVKEELRVEDLTPTPTRIVGANADGDFGEFPYTTLIDSLVENGLNSYTGFTPAADATVGDNVASGDTMSVLGGYGINTSVAGKDVTIEVDTTELVTDNIYTASDTVTADRELALPNGILAFDTKLQLQNYAYLHRIIEPESPAVGNAFSVKDVSGNWVAMGANAGDYLATDGGGAYIGKIESDSIRVIQALTDTDGFAVASSSGYGNVMRFNDWGQLIVSGRRVDGLKGKVFVYEQGVGVDTFFLKQHIDSDSLFADSDKRFGSSFDVSGDYLLVTNERDPSPQGRLIGFRRDSIDEKYYYDTVVTTNFFPFRPAFVRLDMPFAITASSEAGTQYVYHYDGTSWSFVNTVTTGSSAIKDSLVYVYEVSNNRIGIYGKLPSVSSYNSITSPNGFTFNVNQLRIIGDTLYVVASNNLVNSGLKSILRYDLTTLQLIDYPIHVESDVDNLILSGNLGVAANQQYLLYSTWFNSVAGDVRLIKYETDETRINGDDFKFRNGAAIFSDYGTGNRLATQAEINAGQLLAVISGGEVKEVRKDSLIAAFDLQTVEKQSFTLQIYDGDTALPDSSTAAGGLILNKGFFRVPERMNGWDLNVSFGIFDFGTLTSTHTYSVSLTICDGDNANCTNGATANFTLSSEMELSPATTFTVDANDIVRVAVTAPSGCDCGTESVNGLTAVYTLTSN